MSVKTIEESTKFETVLQAQIGSVNDDDDVDLFDASLLHIMESTAAYVRAYYEREIPAAVLASTIRKNCELVDVFDYCGQDYRFHRR